MANAAMMASEARLVIQRDQAVEVSYSSFMSEVRAGLMTDPEHFAQQVGAIYSKFLMNQERLGPEFEDAIYSDLESFHTS